MSSRAATVPNPFYATAGAAPDTRRLLLLSYHFPPSEAAGALRWQKLAGEVAARGWALDVVTLDPSVLTTRDDRRMLDLPPGVRVFGALPTPLRREAFERLAVWAIHAWRSRSRRSAAHSGVPGDSGHLDSISTTEAKGPFHSLADLRRAYYALAWYARDEAWARSAAAIAVRVARDSSYRAVVTCGPPHMIHATGGAVARRLQAPLVLDFRDPWSLVQRLPERFGSTLWWKLADRHERRAVRQASLLVTNTEAHRTALQRRYPEAASRVIAVLNGFDRERVPPPRPGAGFTLAYGGSIYLDRDPRPLLGAAARVIRRRQLSPKDFRILFVGDVKSYSGASLEEIVAQADLSDYVEIQGPRPRREALEELTRADQLVVLPQDSDLAVPSKLYEYLLFPAWILAIASQGSAVAAILAGTDADVVEPGGVEGMAAAIERRVAMKASGRLPAPLASSVPHLSREAQALKLVAAIDALSQRRRR